MCSVKTPHRLHYKPRITTTTILACSECGFLVTFLLFKCFWRDLIISCWTLNSWGLPIIKSYWSSHDISGKVWGDFFKYGTAWSSFSSQRSLWSCYSCLIRAIIVIAFLSQDAEKRTPLHAAAFLGDAEIAELLILSGKNTFNCSSALYLFFFGSICCTVIICLIIRAMKGTHWISYLHLIFTSSASFILHLCSWRMLFSPQGPGSMPKIICGLRLFTVPWHLEVRWAPTHKNKQTTNTNKKFHKLLADKSEQTHTLMQSVPLYLSLFLPPEFTLFSDVSLMNVRKNSPLSAVIPPCQHF